MPVPSIQEIMDWTKPEQSTEEELGWAQAIKPGEYEVYSERLHNICLESKEVFIRSGVTMMLRAGDLVTAIYTPKGDMVAAYCGTYIHAVTAQLPIKYIMRYLMEDATVGVRDGDVFYANDALYGGIHNCDQIAMIPVFQGGELIAWASAAAHQPETGAIEPGGQPTSAKSRYDEGMRLPPIKIGENNSLRSDLLEMMATMVGRTPRMQITDVKARVTAADRIRIRVQQLAEQKGKLFLLGLFHRMIQGAEEGARNRIKGWNDGIYRAIAFLDTTGREEALIRTYLTLHKEGDRLIFDFTGTSPENEGSWNSFVQVVLAHVAYYLYGYPFHDLPVSVGTLAPIDVIVPEGTFLNAAPDAAVSNAPIANHPVLTTVALCFAKMMFASPQKDLVAAPIGNQGAGYIYFGVSQWGVPVAELHTFPLNTEGHGARVDMDGVDTFGFSHCYAGRAADAEDTENEYMFLILNQKRAKDSCGFGKHRGGSGSETMLTVQHVPSAIYYSVAKASKIHPTQGLFGGYPPRVMPGILVKGSNVYEMLAKSKKEVPSSLDELVSAEKVTGDYLFESNVCPARPILAGDIVVNQATGGCGYGDPLQRDPEMVIQDLKDEIISPRTVERVYYVAYDRVTFEVDSVRTAELRQNAKKERMRRAKSYQEFEKGWLEKRPKDEILIYYGSWPDAQKVKDIMRI